MFHGNKQIPRRERISAGDLVEATGFVPLAARPGAQRPALCSLLPGSVFLGCDAQTAHSRSHLHPQIQSHDLLVPNCVAARQVWRARSFRKARCPCCLPLLFPKKCCALFGEPGGVSALGSGTQEVMHSCSMATNKSPAEKESLRGIWSRRRDLCLWRRAPVHSAPRCAVCFPALCFWAAMRKLLTPVRTSTLKSRRNTFNKKQTGKFLSVFWSRRRDLNPRPLGPEPSALPNCATPRQALLLYQTELSFASVFHTAI